jgi:hypothetical protein
MMKKIEHECLITDKSRTKKSCLIYLINKAFHFIKLSNPHSAALTVTMGYYGGEVMKEE